MKLSQVIEIDIKDNIYLEETVFRLSTLPKIRHNRNNWIDLKYWTEIVGASCDQKWLMEIVESISVTDRNSSTEFSESTRKIIQSSSVNQVQKIDYNQG